MDMNNHIELFKFHIMQFIFANRLFREYDLDAFQKQLIQKNKKYLSIEELVEIFKSVKEDLDN
jgi:hypothetical protein